MDYIKQTWVDKETPLDAEHMNHIEEGIAAAHEAIKALPETPEIQESPVQSVNGKTGAVALTADDVGALPADAEIIDTTARDGVTALTEEITDLKENGGAGVAVDATLTESGKAADAKVTGDLLDIENGEGRNLNKSPYTTTTKRGVTFTVNDDHSLALSGSPVNQDDDIWLLQNSKTVGSRFFLPAGTYHLSLTPKYFIGNNNQFIASLALFETNEATSAVKSHMDDGNGITITTDTDMYAIVNICVARTAGVVDGYTIKAQLEKGTAASEYISPWASGVRSKRLDDLEAAAEKTAAYLADKPLERIDTNYMFLPIFHNVGCIGDSLASGESGVYENGVRKYVDFYEHSWGQYLARATGNKYYNFSAGGLTAKTWLERHAADAFDESKKCEAYIIGLGVNDAIAEVTVGTSADINLADYTQNADSFYGNYGKIIQKIKEFQPKAKIFVITAPEMVVQNHGLNDAVKTIATLFDNVYVLDLYAYMTSHFTKGIIASQYRAGHYNAVGYKYISAVIGSYIDWYIYNHLDEFEFVELIGTDYEWTE